VVGHGFRVQRARGRVQGAGYSWPLGVQRCAESDGRMIFFVLFCGDLFSAT
jgi:hypothetical protein